ncbi:MAG: bacteriocin [Desmonostoc vinosum HA7617-LM4]|jgi:bacteriocin-like protein|nr:bacteriocin [Desmonostoc vinosum HA7617-LM4]
MASIKIVDLPTTYSDEGLEFVELNDEQLSQITGGSFVDSLIQQVVGTAQNGIQTGVQIIEQFQAITSLFII